MRRAIGLLIVSALALAVGCGPANQQLGGRPRQKVYRSIVTLSPSTTELLSVTQQLNAQRVRGRTAADNYPKATVDQIPIVASVKPDYEKIAAIKPDLVLYDKDLFNANDVEKIKKLGADTFVLDAVTVDDLVKELYALGSMVGGETNVSDYVDKIYAARAASASITVHPKVAIIMPGDGGAHMIAGTDSFDADVVKSAGGQLVGPKGSIFVPLDPEFLLTQNPDWIISVGAPTALLTDPKLKALKAVSQGKIFGISADILLRRGARVDSLITAIFDKIAK